MAARLGRLFSEIDKHLVTQSSSVPPGSGSSNSSRDAAKCLRFEATSLEYLFSEVLDALGAQQPMWPDVSAATAAQVQVPIAIAGCAPPMPG